METDDLFNELLPIYVGELREHTKNISGQLMEVEKETSTAARYQILVAVLRNIHSLKGASRSIGLAATASVCHEMETIISIETESKGLAGEDFQILFKAVDFLESMGQLLSTGDENAERILGPVLFNLRDYRAKLEQAAPPEVQEAPKEDRQPKPIITRPTTRTLETSVRLPITKLDTLVSEGLELVTVTNRNAATLEKVNQLQQKVLAWQGQNKKERRQRDRDYDRLQALIKDLEQIRLGLRNGNRQMGTAVAHVTGSISGLRMVPIGQACQGMDRMVRDLALNAGKHIQLQYSGMETEVDRNILEQIKDPLMHLVRNACDHGIETTDERVRNNKPPMATIKVAASLAGNQVQLTVKDDGRGINLDSVATRAHKLGLPPPENESDLKKLLFTKGFTTASFITEISGRGIGLDVVKETVEALHGTVDFQAEAGRGTDFVITLPLTLSNMRVLYVRAGGQLFAVSTASIERLIRVAPQDFQIMEGQTVLPTRAAPLPVVALAQILELPGSAPKQKNTLAVVLASTTNQAVVIVDELLSEQEVLVKDLGKRIRRVKYISGSTILPDGKIVLIVNSAEVLRSALNPALQLSPAAAGALLPAETKSKRLLLVDDSITTRSIEKQHLESAGFEVTTCADGLQAWQIMQDRQFDLVVADVEMPNLDGFALTRKIKSALKHKNIPVVLVTALASERHKALGIAAGANAYLIKSDLEHSQLVEVINQLL